MHELGRTWARITAGHFGVRPEEAHAGLRVLVLDATDGSVELEPALEPWLSGGAQLTIGSGSGLARLRERGVASRCHRVVVWSPGFLHTASSVASAQPERSDAPVAWGCEAWDIVVALYDASSGGGSAREEVGVASVASLWSAVAVDGLWIETCVRATRSREDDAWPSAWDPVASGDEVGAGFVACGASHVVVRATPGSVGVRQACVLGAEWCSVRVARRVVRAPDPASAEVAMGSFEARALPGGRTRCVDPRRLRDALARALHGETMHAPPRRVHACDGGRPRHGRAVDAGALEGETASNVVGTREEVARPSARVPEVWQALAALVDEETLSGIGSRDVDLRALPFAAGWVDGGDAAAAAPSWQSSDGELVAEADTDVLAIVAHPDDEILELGGTLARLVDEGAKVHVVVATAGEGGRDARAPASASRPGSGEDLGAVRQREHEQALAALLGAGVQVSSLGLADTGKYLDGERRFSMGSVEALRRWGVDEVVGRLVEVIRRTRPLLVLGHAASHDATWSLHGHHLALGVATAVAIVAAADARVRCSDETLVPWRTREHRVVIAAEVAETASSRRVIEVPIDPQRKAAALAEHRSQGLSLELPIARLHALAPSALRERFAAGVELRDERHRAPRSWLASIAATRREPSTRAERVLAGPPAVVASTWGAPLDPVRIDEDWSAPRRAGLRHALASGAFAQTASEAERVGWQALAAEGGVAVVAGQQVGVFGGPAFTLGKALDAWAHARSLRARGIMAVPVFWMATFDHDLDEVTEILAGRWRDARRARLRHEGRGRVVGSLPLGEGIHAALDLVDARLADSPHRGWTMSLLRRHWSPEATFAGAFVAMMRELVAPLELATGVSGGGTGAAAEPGLVWLDPSTRAIAALGREVVAAALFRPQQVRDAITEGTRALERVGLAPVVGRDSPAAEGRVHSEVFFTDEAGVRSALWFDPRGGHRTAQGRHLSTLELETMLHDTPERLTPSVLLRPLMQARVLPAIGFVAGPTELRYLGQLGALHRELGLAAPRVIPRRRLDFARSADLAALGARGISPALAQRSPDVAAHLLRSAPAAEIETTGGDGEDLSAASRKEAREWLAQLRRLAVRQCEWREHLGLARTPTSAAEDDVARRALSASCVTLAAHAGLGGLRRVCVRALTLGGELENRQEKRAGARAIRGVWRILPSMRRDLDLREPETRAAVAALERLAPARLAATHALDRDLGVVDLMADGGPELTMTLAARLQAFGATPSGVEVVRGRDFTSASRDLDHDLGSSGSSSTLVVLDTRRSGERADPPLPPPHPWLDERARRALRASLAAWAGAADVSSPPTTGTEAAGGARRELASVHDAVAPLRVAVLGMGGLGGSGKVAGEVASMYAQAGHDVVHWTSADSRWAVEFDRLDAVASAGRSHEGEAAAKGAARSLADLSRPAHGAMPVPETPSRRDQARFEADVERLAEAIALGVAASPVDVVHVHYADVLLDATLLARSRVAELHRFAVMVTLHGTDVTALASASPRARELCALLEDCEAVTTPSRFLAAEAVQRLGIPAPVVVTNAIEPSEHGPDTGYVARERLKGDGEFLVAHASNLRAVKRPVDAAKVVARLRERGLDARFVVAGEGPLQEALIRELDADPDLAAATTMLDVCSTVELREVFAAADVLLVTSESESFSLVALEALAAGTLVVGTRCGGLEELLVETFGAAEADAMLAPVGDVEALAARVAALVADGEKVTRLQRIAVSRTRQLHPRASQRAAYLALLERVTAGRVPRARRLPQP